MNFLPLIIAEWLALRWICRHLKGILIFMVLLALLSVVITVVLRVAMVLRVWPPATYFLVQLSGT